ncbi:hypothetical protein GJ496_000957 [Pomphorhynchus laevis]|nr:hypothetical protein GJ496_000957 [Pomphorhynchus laevis]
MTYISYTDINCSCPCEFLFIFVFSNYLLNCKIIRKSQVSNFRIVSVQIILGAIFTFGMSLASSAAFIALQTDFNIRRCNGRLLSALAFSGGGIGEMTFPLLCQYFLDKYNWQDSSLLLGGLVLNVVAFGILLNGRTLSTAVIPMKMLSGGKIAIGNLAKSELSAKQYSTCDDSNSSRQQLQRSSTSASTDQHQHRQDTVKSDEQKHFENTTISFCRSNFKRCKNWIRSIIDFNVLKHSHFWLFSLSSSVSVMAQNAPLIFLADHITSEKIPLRSEIAYSVIGAQSIVSELIAGFIIDRRILNNWIIYVLWTLLSGLSCVLLFFKTVMCIILFCVLYGFGISFNYVITIALMSEIFSEDSRYTAYGFLEMTQGLAMLIGIPLSGMLRDKFGSYQSSFVFTFICKFVELNSILSTTKFNNFINSQAKIDRPELKNETSLIFNQDHHISAPEYSQHLGTLLLAAGENTVGYYNDSVTFSHIRDPKGNLQISRNQHLHESKFTLSIPPSALASDYQHYTAREADSNSGNKLASL